MIQKVISEDNDVDDILTSISDMTLKRKSFGGSRNNLRKLKKKWFDKDCHILLREVKSAIEI